MARDLVLDVLAVNRRAQALYQRLGLTDVTSCGDRGTKVTMRSAHHRK
jgi:ribosomal protein S18 acetylase RimI-like enzyme